MSFQFYKNARATYGCYVACAIQFDSVDSLGPNNIIHNLKESTTYKNQGTRLFNCNASENNKYDKRR